MVMVVVILVEVVVVLWWLNLELPLKYSRPANNFTSLCYTDGQWLI